MPHVSVVNYLLCKVSRGARFREVVAILSSFRGARVKIKVLAYFWVLCCLATVIIFQCNLSRLYGKFHAPCPMYRMVGVWLSWRWNPLYIWYLTPAGKVDLPTRDMIGDGNFKSQIQFKAILQNLNPTQNLKIKCENHRSISNPNPNDAPQIQTQNLSKWTEQ